MSEPNEPEILSYEDFRKRVHMMLLEHETTLYRLESLCDSMSHSTIARFAKGQAELTGPKINQLAKAVGVQVLMPED